MQPILKEISVLAIKLGDVPFSNEQIESQWLGNPPASLSQIAAAEKNLGVRLPEDYRDFLMLTNGFAAINDCTEPKFEKIEDIDYLINIDPEFVDIWNEHGVEDVALELNRSILVGGIQDEQFFLLIPPKRGSEQWKYWKFASWIPGEHEFEDLNDYFLDVLNFLKENSNKE